MTVWEVRGWGIARHLFLGSALTRPVFGGLFPHGLEVKSEHKDHCPGLTWDFTFLGVFGQPDLETCPIAILRNLKGVIRMKHES